MPNDLFSGPVPQDPEQTEFDRSEYRSVFPRRIGRARRTAIHHRLIGPDVVAFSVFRAVARPYTGQDGPCKSVRRPYWKPQVVWTSRGRADRRICNQRNQCTHIDVDQDGRDGVAQSALKKIWKGNPLPRVIWYKLNCFRKKTGVKPITKFKFSYDYSHY